MITLKRKSEVPGASEFDEFYSKYEDLRFNPKNFYVKMIECISENSQSASLTEAEVISINAQENRKS